MNIEYPGNERREFLRIEKEVSVKFAVCKKDEISPLYSSITKNISSGGALFVVNKSLLVDDVLVIEFEKNVLSDVIEIDDNVVEVDGKLLGKVVRVEELEEDKEYEIGVCFVKGTDENVDSIKELLKKN
jgi:c-di-GMP-binding flagellar brake protein YcgR